MTDKETEKKKKQTTKEFFDLHPQLKPQWLKNQEENERLEQERLERKRREEIQISESQSLQALLEEIAESQKFSDTELVETAFKLGYREADIDFTKYLNQRKQNEYKLGYLKAYKQMRNHMKDAQALRFVDNLIEATTKNLTNDLIENEFFKLVLELGYEKGYSKCLKENIKELNALKKKVTDFLQKGKPKNDN